MKRKIVNEHADVMRQKQYPMPGTDLGFTNAIPFNEAEDVDESGGHYPGPEDTCSCGHMGYHSRYNNKHGDHISCFSYTEDRPKEPLEMASNPTRAK